MAGQPVQGGRQHGGTDKGSPVKIGGKAVTSAPTDVDDGDRVDAYFDTKGRLVVKAENAAGGDIGGSGGTASTDDGAFTVGAGSGTPIMGLADETSPDSVDEGDVGVVRMTLPRALHVNLRDASGAEVAVAGGTQYTEDAAAAANPVGNTPILVRKDTPAATVTTDGDNIAQRATNYGAAYVQVVSSAGAFVDTFGGGTQYTEADTDASITGTAVMWEDTADTLRAVSAAKPLPVGDAGGSLTVDGTVGVSGTVAVTQSGTWDEVGINDSGNSITVDNATISVVGSGTEATAQRVTIATDSTGVLSVDDNGSSLTVDGTVTANLAAGTNNIGDVDVLSIAAGDNNIGNVDIVTLPSIPAGTNNIGDVDVLTLPGVGGLAAHAAATSGNPVYVAGRASTAVPTDVGADGDAAGIWTNRNGAPVQTMAPHVGLIGSPWDLVHEAAQYTTTQTSAVLVAGGASEKIVVTKVQIQVGGTTAGTLQLYFGTGAYSRGTSRALFDGEFAPSATLKPGVVMDGPFIAGTNGDDLMVTTSAALNPLTISTWYYLVT